MSQEGECRFTRSGWPSVCEEHNAYAQLCASAAEALRVRAGKILQILACDGIGNPGRPHEWRNGWCARCGKSDHEIADAALALATG
jgi:hypothetical protein